MPHSTDLRYRMHGLTNLIIVLVFLTIEFLALVGCGDARVESNLVKVSGFVHVDGKPAEGIVLTMYPKEQTGAVSTGISGQDGAFQISTNELGDGASPGEYQVTCVWSEFDPVSRSQKGDRLNGLYASPEKTIIRWTVVEGQDLQVGIVELKAASNSK
jgi:hypothetical protein